MTLNRGQRLMTLKYACLAINVKLPAQNLNLYQYIKAEVCIVYDRNKKVQGQTKGQGDKERHSTIMAVQACVQFNILTHSTLADLRTFSEKS